MEIAYQATDHKRQKAIPIERSMTFESLNEKTRRQKQRVIIKMAERKRFELLVPFGYTRFPIVLLKPGSETSPRQVDLLV